jgi:Tol biopolymer transport system component
VRVWLALLGTLPLLAVGSGATASNSAPPRNGLIAVNGSEGIYIVDARAGTATLAPKTESMGEPAWSPDGTLLAASSWGAASSGGDESPDVYTLKPDGSDMKLVVHNAYSPSWSPDGKQLAFLRDDAAGTSLEIADVNDGSVRPIDLGAGEDSSYVSSPSWSPDGKAIAYIDGSGNIRLVSPDGERIKLPAIPASGTGLSWSPDSTKLAFSSDVVTKDSARMVVATLDIATGKEAVLQGEQLGAQNPVWAPEGNQIAFLSMSPKGTASSSTTPVAPECGEHFNSQLWAMGPDGTKAHRLVEENFYGPASWARAVGSAPTSSTPQEVPPTQQALPPATQQTAVPQPEKPRLTASRSALATTKTATAPATPSGAIAARGANAIYLVDPKGANASKVPGTAEMSAPAWSPNMKLLAVEKAEKGGGTSVYTIRPDGSQSQLVMVNASAPSWSAEGDRIFAVHGECSAPCDPEEDAANVLYSARLDGTDPQRVDFGEADAYDGRELAWPTDGRASHFFDEESLIGADSFDSRAATWSPDETRLAFADDKTGLWVVSADGGRPQLLLAGASGRPSWGATQMAAESAPR